MEEAGWPMLGCLGSKSENQGKRRSKQIEVRKLWESKGGDQKLEEGEIQRNTVGKILI